jgi:hypothetical protein
LGAGEVEVKKTIFLFVILYIIAINAFCYAEQIVFEGTPFMRNSSSTETAVNEELSGEAQINYKLIITKDDKGYIWFSRDKKRLHHTKSGIFDYFVNPDGSGYIKISKAENGQYLYLEHMSLSFQTISYWGIADKFEP